MVSLVRLPLRSIHGLLHVVRPSGIFESDKIFEAIDQSFVQIVSSRCIQDRAHIADGMILLEIFGYSRLNIMQPIKTRHIEHIDNGNHAQCGKSVGRQPLILRQELHVRLDLVQAETLNIIYEEDDLVGIVFLGAHLLEFLIRFP